jgi:hypothetical protein
MKRTTLAASMILLALLGSNAMAEETAATAEQQEIDLRPINALKRMGASLQSLQKFTIETEVFTDSLLEDGQKIELSSTGSLEVERPNKLYTHMSSTRADREFYFDGKHASLFGIRTKYYTTVPAPATINELIQVMQARYGITLPLTDLFIWGTDAAPTDAITKSTYIGRQYVRGVLCDQYAYRQGDVDWQIWLESNENMLPRKIIITSLGHEARPQNVTYLNWNLKPQFKATDFTFKAPKDALPISIVDQQATSKSGE